MPVPPVVPSGVERVLGVVPQVVHVKGFLGSKTTFLNLVVTDRRLILAEQSEQLWDLMDAFEKEMKARFEDSSEDWRTFVAAYDYTSAPWLSYLAMHPDQILTGAGERFAIGLGEVQSVAITLQADADPDFCSSTLLIRTASQSWDLELTWGNGDEAYRLLSPLVAQTTLEGPEPAGG
jgi:hypothetical protein